MGSRGRPIRDIVVLPGNGGLLTAVAQQSGQRVQRCYQCGKCSAGCPAAYAMDMPPHQVMRSVQLGLDEVLQSSAIWLCIFCQTCSARCPCEIDVPSVMESLRMLAVARGYEPAEKEVFLFHQEFLKMIKGYGRVPELRLGANFNRKSRHFFANAELLPYMLFKKKVSLVRSLLLPPKAKGVEKARKLFDAKTSEGAHQR